MPRFNDPSTELSYLEKNDILMTGSPDEFANIQAQNLFSRSLTYAQVGTLISASSLIVGQKYNITNAVGSTLSLLVTAVSTTELSKLAINVADGVIYTYDYDADTATEGIAIVNLDLEPQAAPTYLRGRVWYDSTNECLSFYDDITGTSQQVNQEEILRARNATGSTILNGAVVYINGATGQNPRIALALGNAETTSRVIGVATHDISNNSIGKVTTFGVVNEVNTSAYTEGDLLWLSTSVAGGLTTTKPSAPNRAVLVGTVLYAHASSGKILVHPSNYGIGLGTANQILGVNSGATDQEYKTLSGTSNQVTVTHSAGGITLALPQSIATTSSPTFAGLTASSTVSFGSESVLLNHNVWFGTGRLRIGRNSSQYFDFILDATSSRLIGTSGGKGAAFGTSDAFPTVLQTNGVDRLTISGTGVVTLSTALGVASGGTGITTTPSNGFIPIGNGTNYVAAAITGTANQVTVTNASGSITLSLPQSINTTATPQFARIGVGGSALLSNRRITIEGTITGGVTSYGVDIFSTIQSDVTTKAHGYRSNLSTQAIAFVLPDLEHFTASFGGVGAGSSVTNQTGFLVQSNVIGATNNFGFRHDLASATGVWGFYANGTARNYFNGNVQIGSTTATAGAEKLQVTGTASISGALSIGNTVQVAAAVASTHKVTMVIGGVTYYLLATNV